MYKQIIKLCITVSFFLMKKRPFFDLYAVGTVKNIKIYLIEYIQLPIDE